MGRFFPAVVVLGLWSASVASGQSLADVAREEQARRRVTRPATKVYTNGDLKPMAPTATSSTPAPSASADAPRPVEEPVRAPSADPAPTASAEAAAAAAPVKDQAYWRRRATALREDLERKTEYVEAMQTRVNALTTDFTNRDDPAQRARIGVERQRALAELDRLKAEIIEGTKAIADLEEEARRARVPPGWLR